MANNTDLSALLRLNEFNKNLDEVKAKIQDLATFMSSTLGAKGSSPDKKMMDEAKKAMAELRVEMQVYKTLKEEMAVVEKQAGIEASKSIKSQKQALGELKIEYQKIRNEILQGTQTERDKKNAIAETKREEKARTNEIKILYANLANLSELEKNRLGILQQESVASKSAIQDFKLQSTAMNMNASAYERLKAQSALASNAALEVGAKLEFAKRAAVVDADAVNKLQLEYTRLSKIAQESAHSLTRLEQETGKMTPRTMSAYGATFSLTQVMRELPNFAQSARIGFMSLSNNLPMLADDFRRLSKEVNGLTGKANGFSGALKIFSKELIGFNAIVIIATTLITIYGESIVKWIGNLWNGIGALNAATQAQKSYNDAMTDAEGRTGTFRKDLLEVKNVILAVTDGLVSFDSKGKANIKTWEEQKDKTDAYSRALNVFNKIANLLPKESINLIEEKGISNAEKFNRILKETVKYYQQLIMAQAQRQAAEETANKIIEKENDLRERKISIIADLYDIKEGAVTEEMIATFDKETDLFESSMIKRYGSYQKFKDTFKDLYSIYTPFGVENTKIFSMQTDMEKAQFKFFINSKKNKEELTSLEKQYQSQISKSMLSFGRQDDKQGSGSGARTKQLREQFEKEIYYNALRARLVEDSARQEIIIEKERTDGTENSFDERFKALQEYTYDVQKIAEIDLERAKFIANEKYDAEKIQSDNIYKNNLKKFKEGSKEYDIAVEQHNQVLKTIEENKNKEIFIATDEFNKSINDNTRKSLEENLKIRTDFYEEENRLAKIRSEQAGVEFNQKQADEKLAQMKAEHDKINDIFVSSDNRNRQREIDSFRASQDLLKFNADKEVVDAEEKLNRAIETGVGIDEAWKESLEAQRKANNVYHDMEYNEEVFQQERINKLKEQLKVESVNALKTIEEEYFKWQQDKLDKQADKLKKINDEEQKQNEDKLKAGVISEQQAEDAKKRIADYGLMQQEEIARQKKELERKQFLLEKNIALAEITINTAVAIAKAGTNYEEIIAAAAVGTVQTVAVVATMFPEYKDGTRDFKGGYAKVNDGGVPEVIKEPNKEPYILNGKDVISYFPQGTDIYRSVDEARNNGVIRDENISIQRKLDRLVFTNVNNFNDNRIVNEISGLRMDMRKSKSRGSSGLKIAKDYRDKLNGIA